MSQVNVVVPAVYADLVRKVGKRLRERDGFADSLCQFLDHDSLIPEPVRQTLAQQIADAVVAAIVPILEQDAAATSPRRQTPSPAQRQQFKMDL